MKISGKKIIYILSGIFFTFFAGCCGCGDTETQNILFEDDFSTDLGNWWFEGTEKVFIADGKLHIDANSGDDTKGHASTVWCRERISAENVVISFDAYVVGSSTDINNINFFLNYSNPDGTDIYDTRQDRLSGSYSLYHDLNGYIFTYVNDVAGESPSVAGVPKGRFRIRRCPGFELLSSDYTYNGRGKIHRHIEIIKEGNKLQYKVDGTVRAEAIDENPWNEGYFGFRTFRTELIIDNLTVRRF